MRCEICEKAGLPHKVFVQAQVTYPIEPNFPFWDEEDNEHKHDLTTTERQLICSNGHKWKAITREACPVCGAWWEEPNDTRRMVNEVQSVAGLLENVHQDRGS